MTEDIIKIKEAIKDIKVNEKFWRQRYADLADELVDIIDIVELYLCKKEGNQC